MCRKGRSEGRGKDWKTKERKKGKEEERKEGEQDKVKLGAYAIEWNK